MSDEPDILDKARKEHERLLREDPQYRKSWEEISALLRTVLCEADIPDQEGE